MFRVLISLFGSNSFSENGCCTSVSSSACSDDGTILIIFTAMFVESPAGSVTTGQDNVSCSHAVLFMSIVASGLGTSDAVSCVTPDRRDVSDSLDGLFLSIGSLVIVVSVGCISGRSGRVSSGSVGVL